MEELYDFPELGGLKHLWHAQRNQMNPTWSSYNEYTIFDKKGRRRGVVRGVSSNAELRVCHKKYGADEYTGSTFDIRTREGLLQAVRLTYLKTQKPLSEKK